MSSAGYQKKWPSFVDVDPETKKNTILFNVDFLEEINRILSPGDIHEWTIDPNGTLYGVKIGANFKLPKAIDDEATA